MSGDIGPFYIRFFLHDYLKKITPPKRPYGLIVRILLFPWISKGQYQLDLASREVHFTRY
jgi:hypothetical protein